MVEESKYQPSSRYELNDLVEKLIKKIWTDNMDAFRKSVGFSVHDAFNAKEQTILKSIKHAFEGENMKTRYSVLGYRIDFYFHDYKLVAEVDEYAHKN